MSERQRESVALVLATLLCVALSGYRFGTGDHVSQFPSVLHFFDPELYTRDFRLQMIFPPHLKVGLHVALFSLARALHLPVEAIYFAVFLGTVLAFFALSARLLELVGVEPPLREAALYLMAVFAVHFPGVSHFRVMGNELVPYVFVLPLLLAAIWAFLRGREGLSSWLAALSLLVHQQLGLILFLALAFGSLAARLRGERLSLPRAWGPFLAVLLAYLGLLHLSGEHHRYPWFDLAWGRELLEMVRFRVPHHLLVSHAGPGEWVALALTLPPLAWGLGREGAVGRLALVGFGLALVVALGALLPVLCPLPVVLNLYLLRADVPLRVVAFVLSCAWIARKAALPRGLPTGALRVAVLSVSLVLLFFGPHVRLSVPRDRAVVRLGRCLQERAPLEALVLAPPDLKGLRLYGQRSVVASFKSHGLFSAPDVAREWFRRLRALCALPAEIPCRGFACRELCRRNFDRLSAAELRALCAAYEADYLVARRDLPWPRVCAAGELTLYRVEP